MRYVANWVVVAGVAPFVEELIYRGLGYSLLAERFGRGSRSSRWACSSRRATASSRRSLSWQHFGCGLAWLRSRTNSVLPGMIVHCAFNSVALASSFF